ncbi:MAG: DNA-3-methyladenine glycosylase [Acidobacteria bacterium]|nr:DNA-3-methyladenine glycosylase [Acidobacteriota bacterium]
MTAARRAGRVLPRAFYARPTLDVARDLLGAVLVHRESAGVTSGRIVDVEAYIGESDPACHASRGRTPRNGPLYGPPGCAYVYFTYGMHDLVNVVTEREGFPAAVLIRALEPLEGINIMRSRRGSRRDGALIADHDVCRGPGNLARAMGIGLTHNTRPFVRHAHGDSVWIEDGNASPQDVAWTPRIGIRHGTDRPWRGYVVGSRAVSGKK